MALSVTHSGHGGPGTNGPRSQSSPECRHSTNPHNLEGCGERERKYHNILENMGRTWVDTGWTLDGHELIWVGHGLIRHYFTNKGPSSQSYGFSSG